MNKTLVGLTTFLLCSLQMAAQMTNINLPGMDEAFRRAQLMGNGDLSASGSVRPYEYSVYDSAFDNSQFLIDQSFLAGYTKTFSGKAGKFALLPVMLNQQYNSASPFGWNDGSMISARGYQLQVSAGFFFQYGPLHIQVNPEVVWAQNQNFTTLQSKILNTTARNTYNKYYHWIDNPEKMGKGSYQQVLPGQSSITLNVKSVAVGISSENLWWGPGIVNSLVMSNNAPGFNHLSFNTTKPLRTPVGSFEWQLISGITKTSKADTLKRGRGYVNGLILTYQPKWLKGLSIGWIRNYNLYYDTAVKQKDYFPVLGNLFRSQDKVADNLLYRDQVASVFFRYVFQKAHAEIYAEYGRNDAAYDLRDLLMTPEHTRAFIIGGQKLFALAKKNQFIQVQSEITQLQQPAGYQIRSSQASWYIHSQVTRGYTNEGKVLGAGIGPGSNCRNIAVKWIRENSITGINLEQIERNNDLYYLIFTNSAINRKWVDNVIGFTYSGSIQRNVLIDAEVDYIRSQNYHWLLDQYSPTDPANNITEYKGNLHLKVSLVYKL